MPPRKRQEDPCFQLATYPSGFQIPAMSARTIADEARKEAGYMVLIALIVAILVLKKSSVFPAGVSLILLTSAFLLWRRNVIGIHLQFVLFVIALLLNGWKIYQHGFTFWAVGSEIAIAATFYFSWRKYAPVLRNRKNWDLPIDPDDIPEPADEQDDEKPMISIVLLRRRPKNLSAEILTQIVNHAWSHPKAPSQEEDELFAVGDSPIFVVKNPVGMWTVHNHAAPYFEDTDAVVKTIPELRLRKVVQDHRAWQSVDLLSPFDRTLPLDVFYPYIFRLIRELADEDTLAILRPESGQINVWNEEVATSLGAAEPLEEFSRSTNPPVIPVEEGDEMMVAAVAEARAGFPEFRKRWLEREEGESYLVKGPLRHEDNQEFIWISVTGLGDDLIYGNLENQPVDLGGLNLGDAVVLDLAELNDWAIIPADDSEPLGMHTVKAVRAIARRAAAGSDAD